MPDFIWSRFEEELRGALLYALGHFGRSHGEHTFYAVALHQVYREVDGPLCLPLLGAAAVEGSAPSDDSGFWGARWSPPDWRFAELPIREEEARRLERALTAEATRGSQVHWGRVEARYFRALVRIARRLRDEAAGLLRVTDDFVAFWHDAEGGPELAARTIAKKRFAELFSPQVTQAMQQRERASRPVDERAALLVKELGRFEGGASETAERELVALGAASVPALTSALGGKDGWVAAKVLGQIGVPDPHAIAALRRQAPGGLWHAMALGMLGDHEWLLGQTADVAIPGLCARLRAITGGQPRPLDYAPLGRFLAASSEEARRRVEEELEPGTSYVSMVASDTLEVCRGMQSAQAVIRWHAASLADDRSLGKKAGAVLLPALAERLDDPHPIVRRLAVLSLSRWRSAAKPYRAVMAALRGDPDDVVRSAAEYALQSS